MAHEPRLSGVYAIRCTVNGRAYIGSSKNIHGRWAEHQHKLIAGTASKRLQNAWNKYGAAAWTWAILEVVIGPKAALVAREQHYIDREARPYNMATRAGSGPRDGFRHRPESIEKMRQAKVGHAVSAETRRKLSAWRKGRPNPEHAAKITGKKASPETRAKMSASRRKWSATVGVSTATRAKLSASLKGRVRSFEHSANISKAKKGIPHTDAWKAKVSASLKAFHAARTRQTRVPASLADSSASGASADVVAATTSHPASDCPTDNTVH